VTDRGDAAARCVATVLIWSTSVSRERLLLLHATLSDEERQRASRLRSDAGFREFVVGRGVTRELLGRWCGCAPADLVLVTPRGGKPYLDRRHPKFSFNISHSGGYCALVTGNVPGLGVDIERLHDIAEELADVVFTQREMSQYRALPQSERRLAFFRAWTAKEAYLKATGKGLENDLTSLELDLSGRPDIRLFAIHGRAAGLECWRVAAFDVNDEIVGAIAAETGGRRLDIRMCRIDSEQSFGTGAQGTTEMLMGVA
jgi:4'-phosphopantetheinyl transferase